MNQENSVSAEKLCEIGNTHINESRWGEALQTLKAAVKLEPNCAEANIALAEAYIGMSNEAVREHDVLGLYFDEAIEAYRQATRINPGDDETLVSLAGLYSNIGLWASAEDAYLRAIHLNPTNGEGHYFLADLYAQHGHLRNALDSYLEAIRTLDEENCYLKEARFRFAQCCLDLVSAQHQILKTGGYYRADILLEGAGELSRGENHSGPTVPQNLDDDSSTLNVALTL